MSNLKLIVDTSIKGTLLAFVKGEDKVWSRCEPDEYGSAGLLSQLWDEGCAALGCSVADLEAIAVSVGPGSFTGIKVGLAWCYGLQAFAPGRLRWLGLSSLQEAANYLGHARVAVLLPSTQTHGFLAHKGGASLIDISNEPGAKAVLQNFASEGALVYMAGKAWPQAEAFLRGQGFSTIPLTLAELMDCGLKGMQAKLAEATVADFSLELPKPRYLRQSTAEERLAESISQ